MIPQSEKAEHGSNVMQGAQGKDTAAEQKKKEMPNDTVYSCATVYRTLDTESHQPSLRES